MKSKFSVLFAAALLSGCVDGEPDLASVDSELVGGTPTTLRPEIGQFFHNQNTPPGTSAMCTATLIAPRVILTAAHCLDPQPTPVTVPAGARFVFTDASGVSRSIVVDRVHSFGLDPFVTPISGSPLTQDVAIARLVSAVPPSQATPAAIAAQEPTTGVTSTWFGFGCTDRFFGTGAGIKRMITFAFGSSAVGCPGDSGGPQVFTASGAIWGVATGFNFWGTDIFANVVLHKKQIEDVVRGWVGADEVGFDRFGFDYAADIAASATACRTLCERDGNCRAFTWRASDNHCWRKSAASEPTPAAGLVSGMPSKLEVGIDRMGGDYFEVAAATAETCAAACGRDRNCQAWTHLGTRCWFKAPIPAASAGTCAGCTSGVARRGLEVNVDRPGGDFATIPNVISAFDCQSRCTQDWRCEAYTHVGFSCFLKDMVPNAVAVSPAAFMTSGVRRGVETQSDRPGGDLYTIDTETTLTPTWCQAWCAWDTHCVAWSYRLITPARARCTIKNVITPRVFSVDAVSGLKGLEMQP